MTNGPFHRVENTTTQTRYVALKQQKSNQVWGKPARGSSIPSVKAYPGGLPVDVRGVEFTTDITPMPNSSPNEARWYFGATLGVALVEDNNIDFACINVNNFRNGQP